MTVSRTVQENKTFASITKGGLKIDSNETYMKLVDSRESKSSSLIQNEAEMIFKIVICALLIIVAFMLCFFWEKTDSYRGGYSPDDTHDDDGE